MKALVVGAGIGGLAAALSLHRAGIEVAVYERSALDTEAGAGIQLSPNASRVLRGLDLEAAVRAAGVLPDAIRLRDFRSGRLLAERPLAATAERRYGAPYLHIHREALHRILRDAVEASGVTLHTDAACAGVHITGPTAIARFEGDRPRAEADLVVAADGVHSMLRQALFGGGTARASGMTAYRALIEAPAQPVRMREPAAGVWLAPGAHLVHYPVDGGRRINLVAVVEHHGGDHAEVVDVPGVRVVTRAFDDGHRELRALVDAADTWRPWPLYEHPPLPRWHVARAVILGDAAHPLLPFLAQGAAMALEDAWLLGRALAPVAARSAGADSDALAAALASYAHARRPRVARVQQASRRQGRLFHHRPHAVRLARNAYLAFGSRFLPGVAMARYDWLHGHDVLAEGARVETEVATQLERQSRR